MAWRLLFLAFLAAVRASLSNRETSDSVIVDGGGESAERRSCKSIPEEVAEGGTRSDIGEDMDSHLESIEGDPVSEGEETGEAGPDSDPPKSSDEESS